MKATYLFGAGDVRVVEVPDPVIKDPTDALVRVVLACVCGSDLHPFHSMPATPEGTPMGHEFVGVVEEIGGEVSTVAPGDLVIAPFAWSDGTCEFCRAGLQTSCLHGGFWARGEIGGGQAEAIRVPLADGTLVKAPVGEDSALLPEQAPVGFGSLFGPNITLTGGPAPARAYIERLMPAVLDGTVEPGKVFDHTVDLDQTPEGYRAMDRRESLKTLIRL